MVQVQRENARPMTLAAGGSSDVAPRWGRAS
jgi:hypothetical protein